MKVIGEVYTVYNSCGIIVINSNCYSKCLDLLILVCFCPSLLDMADEVLCFQCSLSVLSDILASTGLPTLVMDYFLGCVAGLLEFLLTDCDDVPDR